MKIMSILGIAVAAGIGYVAGMNHRKIVRRFLSRKAHPAVSEEADTVASDPQPEPVRELPPPGYDKDIAARVEPNKSPVTVPDGYDRDSAAREFVNKADSFSGIYEAIHQVASGTSVKSSEVIAEWSVRIHYLNSCPNVQLLWKALFGDRENLSAEQQKARALSLLDFIHAAGVERDGRSTVVVDATTKLGYYTLNGEEPVAGKEMTVMIPCWSLKDKILEKGILTV